MDKRSTEENAGREERTLLNTMRMGIRQMPVWGRYVLISLFCLLFSRIYAVFSHEVSSLWMSLLFLWPLSGALPALLLEKGILPPYPEGPEDSAGADGPQLYPGELMHDLCRFGIAALTAASLLKGILEIAGTDSVYTDLLLAAGALMLAAGVLYYFGALFMKRHGS